MEDHKLNKDLKKNTQKAQGEEVKVPIGHELEVKDLVSPITISRMRILQIGLAAMIGIAAFSYYFVYYIQQPTGSELAQEWVEASGGMEAWNSINSGTFQRKHTLFSDNGEVLKEKMENFFFEKKNGVFELLTHYTTPEGTDLWMGKDDEGYWATLNDLPADPKDAGKDLGFMCDSKWCQPDCAMKMSMYRLGMPFNILGDGVIPTLSGITEINGQPVNVLDVTYRPTVGKDRWMFYADQESNLISKIEYHHKNDHGHEFPEEMYWSDYKEVNGIMLPHSWRRYWTNGKILEDYEFTNFSFNTSLPVMFSERPSGLVWAEN